MKNLAVKMVVKVKSLVGNQTGAQSLEWLGLAALLILILGWITKALDGGSGVSEVVGKIMTAIKNQVGS